MLLSAYCLLLTDSKRRDHIEEIGFLFGGLVGALAGSFSFRGNSASNLGIYPGLALGLWRTVQTVSACWDRGGPRHVDDVLPGRMERPGRGSYQSEL